MPTQVYRNGQLVTVNDYGQTMEEANDPGSWNNGQYVGPAVAKEEQINGGRLITYANGWQKFIPGAQPATTQQQPDTTVTYNTDGTRKETTEDEIAAYYANKKPKTPEEIAAEEERIRQRRLEQQQAEIATIEQMYSGIMDQIYRDNTRRLGSSYNITALTGERGSPSGQAETNKTKAYNQSIVDAKLAEKQAKISQIMSDYQTKINDDILKATELRTKDAEAWLEYQSKEADRIRSNAAELRKNFITAGMAPEEIDDATWKMIADAGGYTVEQAKALYKAEYDSQQAAFVAAEQEKLAREEKARLENEKTKAETEKILSDAQSSQEEKERLLISKGYVYMSTPALRDQYVRKGRVMVTVNGRTYMAPIEKDPNKSSQEEKERLLISKGYVYMSTPALRDQYVRKGRVMVTVNGRTYMAPIEKDPNKKTGGGRSTSQRSQSSLEKELEQEALEAVRAVVEPSGFISPEYYLQFRNTWIQNGGNPTSFDTKFKGVRNPSRNYGVAGIEL